MSQKHPAELVISDFNYDLPEIKIARYPLAERDQSKLLVYQSENIAESTYQYLHEALPENALLIFNNTKVVEARLLFQKPTGGIIELFCLEPADRYPDITTAMLEKGKVFWKCLVGGAKKWKAGSLFYTAMNGEEKITIEAKKSEQLSDHCLIEFTWNDDTLCFAALLHIAGCIPLPPYLNRNAEASDKDRYQTIYAQHDGSVAAPTAGLHFTEAVFNALALKNINTNFVTLHVGAGTFKPVKAANMKDHEMHAEFIDVLPTLINALILQLDHGIIAVGTTSLRTLESLYWMGVKTFINPDLPIHQIALSQWEAYELAEKNIDAKTALNALLNWMELNKLAQLITKTQIIIAPGYTFKIIKALITNFHQPQSTLLLLIAAIVGDDWKKIYAYALENDFRFLSYGDGSLIWNTSFK
ncbi:MAG: S-adenosylmethionine:tRNA ribosyltransferase-isomerase [Sphingobacteriia bacterium]|nr:MAG: S-adenosylmethionine:tRNA ribosyltransferase-isomerase [Sphingobacteriia bacterium]